MKIGDLVKFKAHCRPGWDYHHSLYLVGYTSPTFIALHGHREHGLTARENFIVVSKAK